MLVTNSVNTSPILCYRIVNESTLSKSEIIIKEVDFHGFRTSGNIIDVNGSIYSNNGLTKIKMIKGPCCSVVLFCIVHGIALFMVK